MIEAMRVLTGLVTAVGVVLLLSAALARDGRRLLPRRAVFGLLGLAEAATLLGIVVDIVWLAGGRETPELVTHIGYLLTTPLLIPAGLGLTYKKIDRWGLLIVGVAALITAVMMIRQVQTLGLRFGFLNA